MVLQFHPFSLFRHVCLHTRPCSASRGRDRSWPAVITTAGHEHRHPRSACMHPRPLSRLNKSTYIYSGLRDRADLPAAGRQVVKPGHTLLSLIVLSEKLPLDLPKLLFYCCNLLHCNIVVNNNTRWKVCCQSRLFIFVLLVCSLCTPLLFGAS